MKRSFVRTLWGDLLPKWKKMTSADKKKLHIYKVRRMKMEHDIDRALKLPHQVDFVTYVFGESNYKKIVKLGLKAVLVDKNPVLYERDYYKHKLDALYAAMQDFDEIVYLDWDTKPKKHVDDGIWEELNKKASFQASLWAYKTPKINHREKKIDNRFSPAGGFVYIRDKAIPKRLLELWEVAPNSWSEEPAFSMLTDEMIGGWQGLKKYWETFEPECYKTRSSPYTGSRHKEFHKDPDKIYFTNRGDPWRF